MAKHLLQHPLRFLHKNMLQKYCSAMETKPVRQQNATQTQGAKIAVQYIKKLSLMVNDKKMWK
jgi:hypothetical protein